MTQEIQIARGDVGFGLRKRFPRAGQVGLDLAGAPDGILDLPLAVLDIHLLLRQADEVLVLVLIKQEVQPGDGQEGARPRRRGACCACL